jgi:hypothetical protein
MVQTVYNESQEAQKSKGKKKSVTFFNADESEGEESEEYQENVAVKVEKETKSGPSSSATTAKPSRKRKFHEENVLPQEKEKGNEVEPKGVNKSASSSSVSPTEIFCGDCNNYFVRGDGSYTRHLDEVGCKPHVCSMCSKRFKKRYTMLQHEEAVHSTAVINCNYPSCTAVSFFVSFYAR